MAALAAVVMVMQALPRVLVPHHKVMRVALVLTMELLAAVELVQ
jgi:hypothetical protein